MTQALDIRLGADIGGTFTDIALDLRGTLFSTKVLTNYTAPEQAILDGIEIVAKDAGIAPAEIDIVIHGTTLATNALIERRGARTALVTTDGFRDVIEMRTENRFEQYDLNLKLPTPLIPREDRFPVAGRIGADGQELLRLDEAALNALADHIKAEGFGAVAIGFIHSYMNPAHEKRARDILAAKLDVPISISSEVSPQMREFERFNTVCANAYVRPQMWRSGSVWTRWSAMTWAAPRPRFAGSRISSPKPPAHSKSRAPIGSAKDRGCRFPSPSSR